MNRANLNFHYDKDVDVLYAILGNQRSTKAVEKGNGTSLRIDPKSGEIVGFIVVHYMKRIKQGLLKEIPEFEDIELPKY